MAFLTAIVASAQDAIVSSDEHEVITTWNPAAEQLFGYPAAEAIGQPYDLIMPPGNEAERRDFLRQVLDRGAFQRVETTRQRKDGGLVDVETTVATISDPGGHLLGYASITRDITERKAAEAARGKLVARLQTANRELEQVSAAKSDFVSTISHEFRTPLTSIQGFSELITNEAESLAEAQAFAQTINQNARRLARMVSDVLGLEALEARQREVQRELLSLNQIVARVLEAMQSMVARHRIIAELAPALPLIRGDADLLERVVTNLVANAIKYSPAGGVIAVGTASKEDGVELTVADQGLGVPEAFRESIFSRYGRIARPEQSGIEGTGLGLPIARHILEIHNGRIWVKDNFPAGSIFHVVLPAAEPSKRRESSSVVPSRGGTERGVAEEEVGKSWLPDLHLIGSHSS
jgi:PAS domain S-box-containing protein